MCRPPKNLSPCAAGLIAVGLFGLSVVFLSLLFSALALLWVHLPWWLVFRRCVSVGAASALLLLIKRVQRRTFHSYGLPMFRAGRGDAARGVGLGVIVLAGIVGLGLAAGLCQMDVTEDRVRLWITVLGFLPAAALVGVLEELVFRGFLLQQLLPCSTLGAVCGTSALYAVVHVKQLAMTAGSVRELVGLFLLGVVLALTYLRSGMLYFAIGLHATLAYGVRVSKLLLRFSEGPLGWAIGTSRLVNGVVAWLVLFAIGVSFLRRGRGVENEP